jgi:uncharacterized membrane-anchored protein
MNTNRKLAAALIFPVICLVGLTIYKAAKVASGREIIIPITGYDPRDLLSGRYLTFRLDLNNDSLCDDEYYNYSPIHVCLRQSENNEIESNATNGVTAVSGCDAVITGKCENGIYSAGIERFYIPEEYSTKLDKIIREGKGKIVVSIDEDGIAIIKDLLIDDRSWKDYIKED